MAEKQQTAQEDTETPENEQGQSSRLSGIKAMWQNIKSLGTLAAETYRVKPKAVWTLVGFGVAVSAGAGFALPYFSAEALEKMKDVTSSLGYSEVRAMMAIGTAAGMVGASKAANFLFRRVLRHRRNRISNALNQRLIEKVDKEADNIQAKDKSQQSWLKEKEKLAAKEGVKTIECMTDFIMNGITCLSGAGALLFATSLVPKLSAAAALTWHDKPLTTWICLGSMLPIAANSLVAIYTARKMKAANKDLQKKGTRLGAYVNEKSDKKSFINRLGPLAKTVVDKKVHEAFKWQNKSHKTKTNYDFGYGGIRQLIYLLGSAGLYVAAGYCAWKYQNYGLLGALTTAAGLTMESGYEAVGNFGDMWSALNEWGTAREAFLSGKKVQHDSVCDRAESLTVSNLKCTLKNKEGEVVRTLTADKLAFEQGLTFITGENGTGKTVLLNILAGGGNYKGDVRLNGKDIHSYPEHFCSFDESSIQFLDFADEDGNLMSVRENLSAVTGKSEEEIRAALARVGYKEDEIDNHLKKYASKMSDGEKKRTALARAILFDRPVIFFDEPEGGLDDSDQVFSVLRELAKDHMVIITTHKLLNVRGNDSVVCVENDGTIRQGKAKDFEETSRFKQKRAEEVGKTQKLIDSWEESAQKAEEAKIALNNCQIQNSLTIEQLQNATSVAQPTQNAEDKEEASKILADRMKNTGPDI